MNKPIRRLECCCCGASTRGRQWWNRDTGYGLCGKCAESIKARGRETTEEFERLYGREGGHYNVKAAA